jgi:hypothetical protein
MSDNVRSKESFLFTFKQKSRILNSEYIGSEDEVKKLLEEYKLRGEEPTPGKLYHYPVGVIYGDLQQAEMRLKEAQREWEYSQKNELIPKKEPFGNFLENINRAAAMVELAKLEIQKMEDILKEFAKAKKNTEKNKFTHMEERGQYISRRINGIRYINDKPVKDGKLPDGEKVEDFISRMRKIKLQWLERKQKQLQAKDAAK